LQNVLRKRGIETPVATVVTQVRVDVEDEAFKHPTKPIGTFMEEDEAMRRKETMGWDVVEDAGRGWRRVVASPIPEEVVELASVKQLLSAGQIVITVGGGGIPVVMKDDELKGVAAVIDKDFASSLLAQEINADLFLISTAVEKVALNFGKPDEKLVDRMTVSEAKKYLEEGVHFAKGSMEPKIKAIIWFLENGGKQALITNPENIGRALKGETGTWIVPD
jgi:carbamate kinase